ncbi:MAG: RNA-binding S4 domain-containing protein [Bacteroidales bacterium]
MNIMIVTMGIIIITRTMESTGVRLDKYLWSIRVFKTRADATEACKSGRVTINQIPAKSSREIKEGDTIIVRKGAVHFSYRVIAPVDKRQSAKSVEDYAENITPKEELDKLSAPLETFILKRDRGSGRPTKKDRRKMDDLYSSFLED